jgi:hypothetical protein
MTKGGNRQGETGRMSNTVQLTLHAGERAKSSRLIAAPIDLPLRISALKKTQHPSKLPLIVVHGIALKEF